MQITIYTMQGCPMCNHAIELCKRAKVSFTAIEPGSSGNITRDRFIEKYPNVMGYPFIVISQDNMPDTTMMGLTELARLFLQKGLVSAPKK